MKIKGIIKNLSFLAIAVFMTAASASAQINGGCRSLNNTTTTTTENFDTLATTGTTNPLSGVPTGFGFVETGTNANTTFLREQVQAQPPILSVSAQPARPSERSGLCEAAL
jgi:hypothetical protein